MAKSNFIVRGGADFSQLHQELNKTQGRIKGFGNNINKMLGGMGINFAKLGKLALIGMALKALYNFSKAAIDVASDLKEVQNVVDVTFGSLAGDVNDFSDTAIKQFGLAELSAKKYASTMGAMLKSSGISGKVSKDMSIELAKLSADMASFYNLENDVAFEKIMSGMSGMTMPLKELGINMNIANLEAFAMAQGITKSWQQMSQAEQTMVRYNYLLKVTADSQGDFARNAGTWANQVKILKEQWKQFMSLIGTALIEIALPFVKALNWMLEGLIKITREVGKIYTLLTGRSATVTSTVNNEIADSAGDAADNENKLADGIGKAAKAARRALAPFDEINLLQEAMANGNGGGIGGLGGGLGNLGDAIKGDVTTTIEKGPEDDSKNKWDKFFIWLGDKWNGLKELFKVPILVPSPVFAPLPVPIYSPVWGLQPQVLPSPAFDPIPNPVYNPNWGLDLPPIKVPGFEPIPNPVYNPNWGLEIPKVLAPGFQPIPSPVYNPNWGLELPKIPVPLFPAIEHREYDRSLESIKTGQRLLQTFVLGELARVSKEVSGNISSTLSGIESTYNKYKTAFGAITTGISLAWETETKRVSKQISEGISTTLTTIETNYNKHKANVGTIALGISTVLVANINQGLSKVGTNINNTINTTQNNLETWGKNTGAIASEVAKGLSANISEGLKAIAQNTVNFANGHLGNLKSWGTGVLATAGEVARGFASNMASGFSSTWNSFKSLMSGMGEKISGFFSENKSLVIKTAIVGGAIVGAAALALAVPAAIPFMAGALGGLSAIPALAKGGITDGPMLAMIGDNPGGKEVVSPLDDLLSMMTTAVMMGVQGEGSGGSGSAEAVLNIDGTTIARAMIPKIDNELTRMGYKTLYRTT